MMSSGDLKITIKNIVEQIAEVARMDITEANDFLQVYLESQITVQKNKDMYDDNIEYLFIKTAEEEGKSVDVLKKEVSEMLNKAKDSVTFEG